MAGGIARVGDMVECVCTHPIHVIPIKTTGFFTEGDSTVLTDGLPTVRIGDPADCVCGHTTYVITGSSNMFASGIAVARKDDQVSVPSGPVGIIKTYSATAFNFDVPVPPREVPTVISDVVPAENIQPDATFEDTVDVVVVEDIGDPDSFEDPPPRSAEALAAMDYVGVVEDNSPAVPDETDAVVSVQPPPPNGGSIILDCSEIPDDPPPTLRLSDNYNLASLTTNTAVSNYRLKDQTANGIFYSKKQIACNLSKLATQLLEPIGAEFGKPVITSGFRHGTNKSNHNKGCAADIQWPELNGDEQEYYNRIKWIKDNLIWNELVLEYGGRSGPWLHVSFQEGFNNRTNFKTLVSMGGNGTYAMGQFLLLQNVPGVGGRSFA